MKILAYLALTFVILLILASTAIWAYFYKRNLENPDFIELVNQSNLHTNDIKVLWRAAEAGPITLYENGTDKEETFKKYGKNYFSLMLKDSLLAEFMQFKYNNWHGNHYTFSIRQLNDSLDIQLRIVGPDTLNFSRIK